MKSTINTLISPVYPSDKFEKNLIAHLTELGLKRERNRLFAYIAFSLTCFLAIVPSIILFAQDMGRSTLFSYLSLIVTEHTQIFVYFKDLSLSLIDSIPILSLAILLFVLGMFMWSLVLLTRTLEDKKHFSRHAMQYLN